MITNFLKKFHEQKKIISITTKDIEWDQSIIGYITEINDDFLTINELDRYGMYIGNVTYKISDILCVQLDNKYMRDLQITHESRSIFNPEERVTIWKTGTELIPYFKTIKENEKITRFFFEEDNFVIGIILYFDDGFLAIKNIGEDGVEEGISCYSISDIIGLRYGGLSEQKTKLLYRERDVFPATLNKYVGLPNQFNPKRTERK